MSAQVLTVVPLAHRVEAEHPTLRQSGIEHLGSFSTSSVTARAAASTIRASDATSISLFIGFSFVEMSR